MWSSLAVYMCTRQTPQQRAQHHELVAQTSWEVGFKTEHRLLLLPGVGGTVLLMLPM